MHDFDMVSPVSKRPKVLVQTAAHVASVARFYRQQDLTDKGQKSYEALKGRKPGKIFPVCVHPKYGGWFGLRGILLFENVQIGDQLVRSKPIEIIQSQEKIAELLYLFNDHWRDKRYRDVGMADNIERYSQLQQDYFSLAPDKRHQLLLNNNVLDMKSSAVKVASMSEHV